MGGQKALIKGFEEKHAGPRKRMMNIYEKIVYSFVTPLKEAMMTWV